MRVLVFGASSAQGFWDRSGGWADRLKQYYDEAQFKDFSIEKPHVMNLGISGDGTTELLKRMPAEITARENEKGIAIIIQIGSNNAAEENGLTRSTRELFQKDLQQIIELAKSRTDKVLVVGFQAVDESLTTPVAWRPLFFRNSKIKTFEDVARNVSEKAQVRFVPLHEEFLKKMFEGLRLQAHDGLHPNDKGHQLIFELVQPELEKLLASS